MLRLPLGASLRLLDGPAAGARPDAASKQQQQQYEEAAEEAAPAEAEAMEGASYLRHLTELRWGAPEWEAAASRAMRRFVSASGALAGEPLPDLSPLLQASGLRVLQLAHLPATLVTEAQLEALCRRLPRLRSVQANSAKLLG